MLALLTAVPGRQAPDDPKLQRAVERFFSTQELEDVDAYLAMWSRTADRPQPAQVRFVFESGDDKYSEVAILRVTPAGDRVRVRVQAVRERTIVVKVPGFPPRTVRSTSTWGLVFVREDDDWKLVREGSAADSLAEALIEATTDGDRQALLEDDKDLVNAELVAALARRAGQLAAIHQYRAAQNGFERMRDIARLVGNRKAEGEALQNLANAYYFQQNLPAALEAYQARLVIERDREDPEAIAGALLGVATVRYSFAEYGAALAAYREALAVQEKLGEQGSVAGTLISTGNVLYLQGDYAGALADYARSRELNRKVRNASGEADALEGMGRVLLAQGDYPAALEAFTGVLAEARSRDARDDQGTALLSLGDVHFRLGNYDSARSALDEARRHFEVSANRASEGRAWQALARVDLAAGRYSLSEEEYRRSVATCGGVGDRECAASATVGLAFAQTAQEKFRDGIATYKTAIEAFTALKRVEPAARAKVGLSQALFGAGEFAAASAAAADARADADAIHNDDVLWRALAADGAALRRLKERTQSRAAAESALTAVARLVEAATIRPSAPVPRDTALAFALLALLQAEEGDAAAAFETVERMRVHDLRVMLAPGERDIARGMTMEERDDERRLAVELVSLHAQLGRERGLPKSDPQRIAGLQKRIAEATAARAAQQDRLFARLPALRVWRGHLAAARRADIEALLPDASTILVQFVVSDDTLLTLTARRGAAGVEFRSYFEAASRKAIAERVARILSLPVMSDAAAWRSEGLALAPGLSAVFGSASRAVVIPHEVLWRVPFEALPSEAGVLADTITVVYASSVTALINGRALSTARTTIAAVPGSVVAIGAPRLTRDAEDRIAQIAPGWTLRDAAATAQELRSVEAATGGGRTLVIDGDAATEALVRERLRFGDVLHVAAPFRVNSGSALFSPLLLAADPDHDGSLEPREVMNLDLEARLAILTDGAALGMRDVADDIPAIAWAWQAAGVASLLLPRWQPPETAGAAFLAALHARLRRGESAEEAVRGAGADLRRDPATAAPRMWAAWLLQGR
jgi:tetratricopeptide (TPR) repeat protein